MKTDEQYAIEQKNEAEFQKKAYVVGFTYKDGAFAPFDDRPIKNVSFNKKEGVTLKRCQEFMQKINEKFNNPPVSKIRIHMTEFDYEVDLHTYIASRFGDCSLPIKGKKKEAVYDVSKNTLTIYENDYPVYENADGKITRDTEALMDSYL